MFRARILISVRQASEDRRTFKLQKQFKFCFRQNTRSIHYEGH